jgi:exosome complex component RRP4
LTLHVEKKQLVAPGEIVAEGGYFAGDNVYKENDKVFASRLGLVEVDGNRVLVVPIKGCYIPYLDDPVIGRIVDVGMSGWSVDINAPYPALLPASETFGHREPFPKADLTKIFDVGDLVLAKVIAFDRTRDPLITVKGPELGKATSGRIVKISPTKIPRLIGRKGSMISTLKKQTGCQIMVGQNGIVLVSGKSPEDERVAVSAIYMIEREAHTRGLTDRIQEMIRKELGGREFVSGKAS